MFRPAYGRLALAAALTITTLSACGGPKTPETTSTHQQATGSVSQSQGADSPSQKTGKGLSFAAALDYLQSVGGAPVLDRTDTISGVDANGDGVRDDIATYVASLPDSEKQRKSLIQFHKALNMAMQADRNDRLSLRNAANAISMGITCLSNAYENDSNEKRKEIRKLTINTRVRYDAYARFNSSMSGSTLRIEREAECE